MNEGSIVTIDLSGDDAKYITRYIGKTWNFNLPYGVIKQIEQVFGTNLPSNLLLRRRTTGELATYCLTKIKQSCFGFVFDEEQVKFGLCYQIGKKESGFVKINEQLTVELLLKW